jgi:DHA1 family multidrug resistance protein-like MFS transporter
MIAPIAGGWIIENPNLSWRWTEYVTLIISLFAFLIAFVFLPETHLPTLLKWKAAHLRNLTGDDRYQPEDDEGSFLDQLKKVGSQPVKFWLTEPVITVFGIYLVLLYILLFSFLSGFDYIFKETYDLSPGYTGSCFGASAAGATAFTLFAPWLYTAAREKTEHVRKRAVSPEFRLWPAIIAGPLLSAALFWLGWTARPSITIWSGLAACFVFGGCLCAIYVSTYEYIIDSYRESSSIALASITFVRYLVAGGMVLAARPMFMNIGVQWSLTWLGIVAALLSPAPYVFWWIGGKLRNKSPYATGDDER